MHTWPPADLREKTQETGHSGTGERDQLPRRGDQCSWNAATSLHPTGPRRPFPSPRLWLPAGTSCAGCMCPAKGQRGWGSERCACVQPGCVTPPIRCLKAPGCSEARTPSRVAIWGSGHVLMVCLPSVWRAGGGSSLEGHRGGTALPVTGPRLGRSQSWSPLIPVCPPLLAQARNITLQ